MHPMIVLSGKMRLGDFLLKQLGDNRWNEFHAAIAFAKYSGVKHILHSLSEFIKRGHVRICVGCDLEGTTVEALEALLASLGSKGELWVNHNENGTTFHPKLYLFKDKTGNANVTIGSGNLTEGGLYTNAEANISLSLKATSHAHKSVIQECSGTLDKWCDPSTGGALRVNDDVIKKLREGNYIITEGQSKKQRRTSQKITPGTPAIVPLFRSISVMPAPTIHSVGSRPKPSGNSLPTGTFDDVPHSVDSTKVCFAMTLQQTDVGHGQTTTGTSARSPEVFIPLAARAKKPEFWGWNSEFSESPTKWDRQGVKFKIGSDVVDVNMMVWKAKHDLRLRSNSLRNAGRVGDIMILEKCAPESDAAYTVRIVKKGSKTYKTYLRLCDNKVKGASKKTWGFFNPASAIPK